MNLKISLVVGTFITLLTLAMTVINPGRTLALTVDQVKTGLYNFQDAETIVVTLDGKKYSFVDSNIKDTTYNYKLLEDQPDVIGNLCASPSIDVRDKSVFSGNIKAGSTEASIHFRLVQQASNSSTGTRCGTQWDHPILVGNIDKITQQGASGTEAFPDSNSGSTTEDSDNCVAADSGPMGWILCPVVGMITDSTNFVFEHMIIPFLENVPISLNEKDGTYQAWKQFRLLGNIMLIVTMIVVVYAQIRE